jgi:hypothetical protein
MVLLHVLVEKSGEQDREEGRSGADHFSPRWKRAQRGPRYGRRLGGTVATNWKYEG